MSSRRSIVWLLFFVALAVAAHVLVSIRAGETLVAARPNVLVPSADRATLCEIARTGAPSAVAVRSGRWRLVAPFAAAVDSSVLLRLLDALAFAPVTDVLTEPEMRRLGRTKADFGLDESSLSVAVRLDETETVVRFGRRTPAGDGVYASVSDRAGVSVIASNAFAALDVSLDDLRDPRLVLDAAGAVAAVDVRRSAGKFIRVARTSSGVWKMQDATNALVSAVRVESFVQSLAEARSSRFVWPVAGETAAATPSVSLLAGYGLDAESAVSIALVGEDGSNRSVLFGKNADSDSVYALVQNAAAVVTVSSALRDRLLAEAESLEDLKLFPYAEKDIASFSIADGELVYLLARTPDGGWRIDSPVSAPADAETVQELVQTILSLRTTERDPHGLVVSLFANTPPVAVARDALLVQNRLEDLRSKTVLKMPADRIRRLTATSADGRVEAAVWDAANRTWVLTKPDGATLNGLALAGVLGALDPLLARSVVRLQLSASEAGNYGLEKPRFTLAIDPSTEGGVRRNVLIGAAAPSGGAYATVGSTDAVVILPEATVRALTAPFTSKE